MRGYVATVAGGVAGCAATNEVASDLYYQLYDRALAECSAAGAIRSAIGGCVDAATAPAESWWLVAVFVVCGLAAGAAVWLIRAGAALETALATVAVTLLAFIFLPTFDSALGVMPTVEYQDWGGLATLGLALLAARWLGVAWHRRRSARASARVA